MFNNQQFRKNIIQASLEPIDLYSPEDEDLLIATMAHESKGGFYLVQIKGPAIGVYQMEPNTYKLIWKRLYSENLSLTSKILDFLGYDKSPDFTNMIFDLRLSTIMARLLYYFAQRKLTNKDDVDEIWLIYKTYYNSNKGEAQKDEFIADYMRFIGKEH